jgi:excisionase family DNA binding protein
VLITLAKAARMAGLSKGAIRKAVETGKLTATRDEQGRWRVHAADVERVWQHRAPEPTVSSHQRAPVRDGDHVPRAPGDHDIEVRLAVAEALVGEREREIADLRARIEGLTEDHQRLLGMIENAQRMLTDQRPPAARTSWWRRWWGS